MTTPTFFDRARSLTVQEIAALTGAEPVGGAVLDRQVTGVAALDRAMPNDLTFLDKPKYADQLRASQTGVCLTTERLAAEAPAHVSVLRVRAPYQAFVTAARTLFGEALRPSSLFAGSGVAAGAFVHPSARLEAGVTVDPSAVIGPQAEIGSGTVIHAGAVIGPKVRIGRDCAVGAHVSLMHTLMGDRVIVHPGSRIGQDGFGYVMGPRGHTKVPQIGRVIIQDDVEIGANTTIDRGAIRDTVIGEGTKIDNLVQVGHNTQIGRHCIVVARTGISGSVTLGDFVVLAAGAGVKDHVTIGEGAQIAAVSNVYNDVPAGARWGGIRAKPVGEWMRELASLERLARTRRGGGTAAKSEEDRDG